MAPPSACSADTGSSRREATGRPLVAGRPVRLEADDAGRARIDHLQWTGSWSNAHGDLITYVLQYEVLSPNGAAHTMKVSGIHTAAATVERMRKARPPAGI
jgi:hypothetical protein